MDIDRISKKITYQQAIQSLHYAIENEPRLANRRKILFLLNAVDRFEQAFIEIYDEDDKDHRIALETLKEDLKLVENFNERIRQDHKTKAYQKWRNPGAIIE
jgi:hypothetical protein